jgi:Ca2+-binding RTX toxin-like protein
MDVLHGGDGDDVAYGGGGSDVIDGGAGTDYLIGDGGNDTIRGGQGSDFMTGGSISGAGTKGANTFVWDLDDVVAAPANSIWLDHITDFGTDDVLDLSNLLVDADLANIEDYVTLTDVAEGTLVTVTTAPGQTYDLVVLDNIHGLTLGSLVSDNAILV